METIKTKAYGEIQVDPGSMITFKREILGFEGLTRYYLIEMGDLPNFYWLQSAEEPNLAFVVVNPRLFQEDYKLILDEIDWGLLEIAPQDEVIDFAIVNIPEDIHKMTMNLLGPIVINATKRIAIQGISMHNAYGTKVPLFAKELTPTHT
ncbi:MAG: flagellar assembly protein FliW [Brevinematales bacterium]|nr:flagellar assembly protein FliW [Brevinematales bacterium]